MNPFEHFKKLMEPSPEQLAYQQKLREEGERIEADILMALWKDIGDFSETYWQAIQAMAGMRDLIRHYRERFNVLEMSPVEVRMLEAFIALIQNDIDFQKKYRPPE